MTDAVQAIITFLGPAGIPTIAAGFVFTIAKLAESLAAKQAKEALTRWLKELDVRKAAILPGAIREIFERMFGKEHFSLKCFRRSIYCSIIAIALMISIYALVHADNLGPAFRPRDPGHHRLFLTLAFTWIAFSILPDYVSLFKTRMILTILTQQRRHKFTLGIMILGLDFLTGYLIFAVLFSLTGLLIAIAQEPHRTGEFLDGVKNWPRGDAALFVPFLQLKNVPAALFYAGMLPSIWLWTFVVAVFVTRLLLRGESAINFLRFSLNIDEKPLQAVGAVAAASIFILMAIVLGVARLVGTFK